VKWTAWQAAREGLPEGCNPYSLRHTVARWLRAHSVPVWEVAALLGHKMQGHSVTELYAHADPRDLEATKAALDELLRASLPKTCQSKQLKYGAGDEIRTHDPHVGNVMLYP